MAIGVNRSSASEGQSELFTMIGFPVEEAVAALATFSLEVRFNSATSAFRNYHVHCLVDLYLWCAATLA